MRHESVHRAGTTAKINTKTKNKKVTTRRKILLGMPGASTIKDKLPMPVLVTIVMGTAIFLLLFATARPTAMDSPLVHKANQERDDPLLHHKSCSSATDFRRRLAETVAEVQKEIHRLAGKNAVIDSRWSLKLAAVAEELDPRITLAVKSSWDYSARLPNMSSAPQLANGTRHVCPEVYYGPKHSQHYGQSGMRPENCSYAPDFSSVLTALLSATTWNPETVNFVIEQIRNYYSIPIIVIVSSAEGIDKNVSALTVKTLENLDNEATVMNGLSAKISTPYVLIANSLAHFNNQSSLERLVRVLDELNHVKVAGGAARDLQGHWIHGCLQQRMADYQAQYAMGYYYSKYECMYCDDLLTPFVTTTALIHKIPFTKGLKHTVLYRDWFAKVQVNGHLAMACPDVMFYVSNHPTMNKDKWLVIAKQWSLEKIHSYDGKQYSFQCSSVGINCKNPLGIIRSFLLPPCCRALMEKYLSYLTDYGKENDLAHELQAGSALGAMKMDGYLPWDYDIDILFKCKDYAMWMKADKVLKPKGCHASVIKRNRYITIHCPNFFLELYCQEYNGTSHQYLPPEYQNTPTTIKYSGKDVIVSANPGLHTRSKIGIDDLKHAAHWRTLKVSTLGRAKGGYDNPGVWNQCKNPKHHSCLDHFPGDGNLPFKEPFLHL